MAFLDYIKQVLGEAAPEKYPVLIGKDLFAVVALHDDYVDLRFGSFSNEKGNPKTVEVTNYIRSMPYAEIKSIQPIPDWRIIHASNKIQPLGLSTVSLEEIERQAPGFLDSLRIMLADQGKASE